MRKRCLFFLVFLALSSLSKASDFISNQITVHKMRWCDCCGRWIEYLQSYGYEVDLKITENIYEIKEKLGVPEKLSACHTAVIDGYVVEGHITHKDIKRLLLFRPDVNGIAVPGMPIGTPGMEKGDIKEPYTVFSFDEQGNVEVFIEHK